MGVLETSACPLTTISTATKGAERFRQPFDVEFLVSPLCPEPGWGGGSSADGLGNGTQKKTHRHTALDICTTYVAHPPASRTQDIIYYYIFARYAR